MSDLTREQIEEYRSPTRPAPPGRADAICDMALRTLEAEERNRRLEAALQIARRRFEEIYNPSGPSDSYMRAHIARTGAAGCEEALSDEHFLGAAAPPDSEPRVPEAINVIFDGPPGPTAGRFVEVETDDGKSVRVGEWIERDDGLWALRIALAEQEPEWDDVAADLAGTIDLMTPDAAMLAAGAAVLAEPNSKKSDEQVAEEVWDAMWQAKADAAPQPQEGESDE